MKKQKVTTCNKKERALTFNANNLGIAKAKKGDEYLLYSDDGLIFPVYVNRQSGKTLYCPDNQVPNGFKQRAKLSKPVAINIVKIKKVK